MRFDVSSELVVGSLWSSRDCPTLTTWNNGSERGDHPLEPTAGDHALCSFHELADLSSLCQVDRSATSIELVCSSLDDRPCPWLEISQHHGTYLCTSPCCLSGNPCSTPFYPSQHTGQLWFFERGVLKDARHVDPLTIIVLGLVVLIVVPIVVVSVVSSMSQYSVALVLSSHRRTDSLVRANIWCGLPGAPASWLAWERSCPSSERFQDIHEKILLIHCCMTMYWCQMTLAEYIYHIGNAFELHSIIKSGLIPGGKSLRRDRQSVFFSRGLDGYWSRSERSRTRSGQTQNRTVQTQLESS